MALREFWAYEGVINTGYAGFLRPDVTVTGYYNAYGQLTTNASGWAVFTSGYNPYPNTMYGTYNANLNVPYQNISDFTTRRSFIGLRIQTNNNTVASTNVLKLQNTAGTSQSLLLVTQLALNTSQYVEIMIDRANTQIVVWIDGVAQAPVFFDFNAFVAADGKANLVFGITNGNGINWQMRDTYFLDDTQDNTQCNRLGPVDIRPMPLQSVTAPNWTSSDSGTPLSDLSTVLGSSAATQTAPYLQEAPSMDPVTFQFSNANLVANEPVIGLKADISALRTGGYIFAPQLTAKYNNQTVNGKQLTFPNPSTMVYNQNGYLAEKAPDGSTWTPASIAAAQLILTP